MSNATLLLKFRINLEIFWVLASLHPHGPIFHKWLPDGENDAIFLNTGNNNTELKVWFERQGFVDDYGFIRFSPNSRKVDPTIIPKQAKLDAGPLFGILKINKIKENYLAPLRENREEDVWYLALGKKVIKLLYPPVARFINILRTNYGQYWIPRLETYDSRRRSLGDYCKNILNLEWSLDDGKNWFSFVPNKPTKHVTTEIDLCESNFSKYLTKTDWEVLKKLEQGNELYEPSLAASLLMRSHALSDKGKLREAFIEGYTALEVAINEFFENKILKGDNRIRKNINQFYNLSMAAKITTVAIILDQCSSRDIEKSLKAIEKRNRIVHEGYDPSTLEGASLTEAKDELFILLTIVATLLSGPHFKFPAHPSSTTLMLS